VTSSVTSRVPTVAFGPYASSKAGVAQFFEALHFELKDRIEVFSWDCGVVATKINPYKVGFRSNTVQAVSGCLKDIGCERRSFGSWKHELEAIGTISLPMFISKRIMLGLL
jgi:NAD(P)-dependent dehydrogenase (short-subunit alcohol dehydrogenase family)